MADVRQAPLWCGRGENLAGRLPRPGVTRVAACGSPTGRRSTAGRPPRAGSTATRGPASAPRPGAAALCLDLGARRPDDHGIEDPTKLLSYDDALAVIARLVEVARARGEALRSPIVLVGGTALAGWQIRACSRDVAIYMPEISADAVEIVEHELRATYGTSFRLDVTTGENVWGAILVRDIASSPALGTIAGLELRALRIEDLFLLKLASGRTRDLDDLDLIAPRTTASALVDRWNQLIKWHGDRHAILGFADALVLQLKKQFGCEPVAMIARLEITAGQRALLLDTYHGKGSE